MDFFTRTPCLDGQVNNKNNAFNNLSPYLFQYAHQKRLRLEMLANEPALKKQKRIFKKMEELDKYFDLVDNQGMKK